MSIKEDLKYLKILTKSLHILKDNERLLEENERLRKALEAYLEQHAYYESELAGSWEDLKDQALLALEEKEENA